jgi:Zn-dependent protease
MSIMLYCPGMEFTGITLLYTLITILIGLSVHEAAHAFVGLKLGDTTAHEEGRVSLNPLRHIDPLTTVLLPLITLVLFQVPILAAKPVPFNPARVKFDEFGAALIAFAGPASNFLMALLGALFIPLASGSTEAFSFLTTFIAINVGLFIFNMIPIPPLDGSRILYAFAPESLQEFMAGLENIGLFIIFGLVLAVPAFTALLIQLNSSVLRFLL